MSQESIDLPPAIKMIQAAPEPAADWTHAAEARLSLPTAEQMRSADGVFAHRKEPETAAGLLGLWSSALLLHAD